MRVYLPSDSTRLAELARTTTMAAVPLTGFAVTPGLREHYVDDDVEELEYAATLAAARASLRLLAADPFASRRRVVVSADVADSAVEIHDDLDLGVVRVTAPVALAQCASVHADDGEAEAVIRRAAMLIDAADLGDPDAEAAVDDAEGFELSWYATQEIDALVEQLGPSDGSPSD